MTQAVDTMNQVIADYAIENANLRIAVKQLQNQIESMAKVDKEGKNGDRQDHR